MGEQHSGSECAVTLAIEGDFLPEEITRATGVTPTRTAMSGEPVSSSGDYKRKSSVWEYTVNGDGTSSTGDLIKSIIEVVKPSWEKFVDLGRRYGTGFYCRVYLYEAQGPEIYLESTVIKRVAELGAAVDIDVYCLAGDDEPLAAE